MKTTNNLRLISTILLIMVFAIYFNSCKGQQCTSAENKKIFKGNRVNYNFTSKKIMDKSVKSRPLTMRENSEIQIEITNFNPLKYDIIVGDTAYDRFDANIDDFDLFITLPKTTSELNTSSTETKSVLLKNANMDISCDTLESQLKNLVELTIKLDTRINNYNGFILNIKNIANVYDYLKTLDEITPTIVQESVASNILTPISNALPDNLSLNSSINTVFSKNLTDIEGAYYKDIAQIRDRLTKTFNIVDKINLADCKSKIPDNAFISLYQGFLKNYHEQLKVIDEFESNRTSKILPNFTKIMLVYDKLQSLSQNNPTYVTKSFSINKDVQTIKIYKYDPSTQAKTLHDEINIQSTRGFRIGVSGGLFVSGLYDEKYTLHSKDSIFTTQHIQNGGIKDTIVNEKFTSIYSNSNAKVSFGGMIFLQAHSQNNSIVNYGGYLGIGALFNDQTRWAGSFGISLILGRSHRFIINGGPIISQVDRLTNPYKTNIYYQGSIDNVPISKVWDVSWMLGFSWKIGK